MIFVTSLFYGSVLSFLFFAQDVTYGFKLINELNIVSGHTAKEGEYPYQAGLFKKTSYGVSFVCGGSILDEHHVLTAAHCVLAIVLRNNSEKYQEFFIGVGALDRTDYKNMIVKEIERIHLHEHYEFKTDKNDIALVKIKGSFKFNKYLKPVELTDTQVKERTSCSISGWGLLHRIRIFVKTCMRHHDDKLTQENGYTRAALRFPELLQGATVTISNQTQCVEDYQGRVDLKQMICAGYENGGVNSCKGDSGGPMVCNNKLEGVISWGYDCGKKGYPDVYTRVHTYLDWIRKRMQLNSVDEDDKLTVD